MGFHIRSYGPMMNDSFGPRRAETSCSETLLLVKEIIY
jgi:hypothetical protein